MKGGSAGDVTAAVKNPFDNQTCQRYHLVYPDILSECFRNNWLMTASVRPAAVRECEKKEITTGSQQRETQATRVAAAEKRRTPSFHFYTAGNNQMKTLMNCFNLNETAQKQQLLNKNTFPIISLSRCFQVRPPFHSICITVKEIANSFGTH